MRAARPPDAAMADSEQSGQEKNYDPSAKRLEDARREGQIPRSRELAHLIVLGSAAGILLALAGPLMKAGLNVMGAGLTFDAAAVSDPTRMTARLGEITAGALLAVAPVLGVMLLAAVAAPLLIGGWMFAPQMALPKAERIDPFKGVARMFSAPALVELAKVLIVSVLLALVGGWAIVSQIDSFASLAHQGLPQALAHFGWMLGIGFLLLVATLAVTSAIDVPFQIFHHRSKLKMTLEEVKREQKESEGDPYVKARIRSQQREMARKRMMAAVPQADVVVTNPTHFAVALKYSEGRSGAPVVVAKGADHVAEKIKELARAHGVPQLEAPPLARALYRHVDIGAEIPAALYTAVAQVLAYVFQLKRYAEGRAARPAEPRAIEVPDGLDPLAPRATA
jgi:flagellar biosynthetic protein FlhB